MLFEKKHCSIFTPCGPAYSYLFLCTVVELKKGPRNQWDFPPLPSSYKQSSFLLCIGELIWPKARIKSRGWKRSLGKVLSFELCNDLWMREWYFSGYQPAEVWKHKGQDLTSKIQVFKVDNLDVRGSFLGKVVLFFCWECWGGSFYKLLETVLSARLWAPGQLSLAFFHSEDSCTSTCSGTSGSHLHSCCWTSTSTSPGRWVRSSHRKFLASEKACEKLSFVIRDLEPVGMQPLEKEDHKWMWLTKISKIFYPLANLPSSKEHGIKQIGLFMMWMWK